MHKRYFISQQRVLRFMRTLSLTYDEKSIRKRIVEISNAVLKKTGQLFSYEIRPMAMLLLEQHILYETRGKLSEKIK